MNASYKGIFNLGNTLIARAWRANKYFAPLVAVYVYADMAVSMVAYTAIKVTR